MRKRLVNARQKKSKAKRHNSQVMLQVCTNLSNTFIYKKCGQYFFFFSVFLANATVDGRHCNAGRRHLLMHVDYTDAHKIRPRAVERLQLFTKKKRMACQHDLFSANYFARFRYTHTQVAS